MGIDSVCNRYFAIVTRLLSYRSVQMLCRLTVVSTEEILAEYLRIKLSLNQASLYEFDVLLCILTKYPKHLRSIRLLF
jgi:hypothetical protein